LSIQNADSPPIERLLRLSRLYITARCKASILQYASPVLAQRPAEKSSKPQQVKAGQLCTVEWPGQQAPGREARRSIIHGLIRGLFPHLSGRLARSGIGSQAQIRELFRSSFARSAF